MRNLSSLQGAASSWTDCHFFGDWAGFMAAQIWAFNFAKNYELLSYATIGTIETTCHHLVAN